MKILTVSDRVDELIYSAAIKRLGEDVSMVLSCGDLPLYYLEYIVTMLGGPLFYVIGNHANEVRQQTAAKSGWQFPGGCENLDGRIVRYRNMLIAGLEGSIRYNNSPHFQYTEREMTRKVWQLIPGLLVNRLLYGRYLDILITHAPPQGIHDRNDRCHQGFRVFRTFMEWFRPRYLIHGHIHMYGPRDPVESEYQDTRVINTYGYQVIDFDEDALR